MTLSSCSRPEGRLKWRTEKAVKDSLQPGWNKQLWGENCTFALVQEQKSPFVLPHAQPLGRILFCLLSRRFPRYVHVQLKHGGPPGGWTSWSVEIKLHKWSRRGLPHRSFSSTPLASAQLRGSSKVSAAARGLGSTRVERLICPTACGEEQAATPDSLQRGASSSLGLGFQREASR